MQGGGIVRKPHVCSIDIEYCENCREWEPIPFHYNGGLCLARGKMRIGVLPVNRIERKLRSSTGYSAAALAVQLAAMARGAADKKSTFNVMNVIYR